MKFQNKLIGRKNENYEKKSLIHSVTETRKNDDLS